MIQPHIQFNLANAKQYFREHLSAGDYYSRRLKVAGEWLGEVAEPLGLKATVNESAFLALCEGMNPGYESSDWSETRQTDEHDSARCES